MTVKDIRPEQINPHFQHPELYGLDPELVKKQLGESR